MSLDLSEVIQHLITSMLEQVHTAIPGRVVSYDGHGKRTATVQPSIRLPTPSGPLLEIPAIQGVPVVFPSSAGGSLVFPLKKGDGVLLIVSEIGIGRFLRSAVDDIADPDDGTRHTLMDCIAIPGLHSAPAVPVLPTLDDSATALVSASGGILELTSTLGLRNGDGDLRSELGRLWDELKAVRGDIADHMDAIASGCDAIYSGTGSGVKTAAKAASSAEKSAASAIADKKTDVGKVLT